MTEKLYPAIHLPQVFNAPTVFVAREDVVGAQVYEGPYLSDAVAHWQFDTGDASGLVDRLGRLELTVQNTAPGYSVNYITVLGAIGNGLITPIAAVSEWSIMMVHRAFVAASTRRCLFGNADAGSGGSSITTNVTSGGQYQYISRRPGGSGSHNQTLSPTPSNSTWYVWGYACSATLRRYWLRAAFPIADVAATTLVVAPARPFAISNAYDTSLSYGNIDVAALVYYDRVLEPEEFADIVPRLRANQAAVGMTVAG